MKQFYIMIGNFGSGKTELALNLALCSVKRQKTMLVDLDVINPCFRSTERRQEIIDTGIKFVCPVFAPMNVDVPVLPPDVYAAFDSDYETVIFDVGGNHNGATVLGSFYRQFASVDPSSLHILYVLNPYRPFCETPDEVLEMMNKISHYSRLEISGLINNANMSTETNVGHLCHGYDIIKEVSERSGIKVIGTSGGQGILDEFFRTAKMQSLDSRYIGKPLPISILTHRDWDRFTEFGM